MNTMVVANNAYAHLPKVLYPYPEDRTLPKKRSKAGRALNLRRLRRIGAGVLVVLLALVVIYRYGQISEINMQITEQTKIRTALLDEQRHLEITVSELSSLGRIEQFALEELGMKYPVPGQIRYVGGSNPESGDGHGN